MRASFLVLAGLLLQVIPVHGQDTVWAKSMGGTDFEQGTGVAVDSTGNVYTTGYFRGTVDFDPSPSVFNLTSAGSEDIFLTKLDSEGRFEWAKQVEGPGADYGYGVAVDSSGNVYTTGSFESRVHFDPGATIAMRIADGASDIFVTKHDSNGKFLWVQRIGGPGSDAGRDITIDDDGNVHTTGSFEESVDFDPGPGVVEKSSNGSADIFTSKLDTNGGYLQSGVVGNQGYDVGYGIAVDGDFNQFITGSASTTNGNAAFVWLFTSNGDGAPGRFFGETGNAVGRDIAIDDGGSIYVVGEFDFFIDFGGGFELTSSGAQDIFVIKLDAGGGPGWTRHMGAGGADRAYSVAVDRLGNVFTTGSFEGTVNFPFQPFVGSATESRTRRQTVDQLTSAGAQDIFITKMDTAGNHLWARRMGGVANDLGRGVAVDAASNVYATGFFGSDNASFGKPAGEVSGAAVLVSAGGGDVFVAKYNDVSGTGLAPSISPGGIVLSTLLPTVNTVSPRSIISVFGQSFSTTTTLFADLDGDGNIARILGGTCLEMNGERLPIFAITPTQVNAQVSADSTSGRASFTVVTECDSSNALRSERVMVALNSAVEAATVEKATPGFFLFEPLASDGFIAARFNSDAGAVAPAGMINDDFGPSRPAEPGDIVVLYGTGWGPTKAALGTGQLATEAAWVLDEANPTVSFGGIFLAPEDLLYVGVTPNAAGLYQLAIRVPAVAIPGDYQVVLTVYGKSTPVGPVMPVVLKEVP